MSRLAVRRRADHHATADVLREMPGVELLVATYRAGSISPNSMALVVRKGQHGYTPPGAFEARIAPVDDETGLYVRYVGATEVTA
jgi:hypothetical protein